MTLRAVVTGVGSYLPERIVTNTDLEKTLDTSDAWIVERTGIKQRHIAAKSEFTSHLGTKAAARALTQAGLDPHDVDLLLLATTTPDQTLPATATKIQYNIGIKRGAAFDINAACSGFIYALATANSFIQSGNAKKVLVIGAETYSRIIDWNDRSTAILFGDGAAALVLEAQDGKGDNTDRGILSSSLYSDGQYIDILKTTGGVSSSQNAGVITMAGKEVFRHGIAKMADTVEQELSKLSIYPSEIDWLIPHQANIRILKGVAQKLGISEQKLIVTLEKHANTSAASIPLAIDEAASLGKLLQGQLLILPALGAGLTWGACILRW